MIRTLRSIVVISLALAAATNAQTADHLQCYKVKDPQPKTSYTATLDGLVTAPGCVIKVPAVMACVPATKTNVDPLPPGGGGTGTPNGFFCYKAKCPSATLPPLPGADQFGSRTVTPRAAKLLCAPLAGPSTTTTTTTAASSTTTTTTISTTTTTLRFVDNGDGTVTDNHTGLQWEQKVAGSGCLHCVDDTYTWSASENGNGPDGTVFTSFFATLNGGVTGVGDCTSAGGTDIAGGFNGHCDWRLPTIVELSTIVDVSALGCNFIGPCIDPIFGPTRADDPRFGGPTFYWSSTTWSSFMNGTWGVEFFDGVPNVAGKIESQFVRAVRGGS